MSHPVVHWEIGGRDADALREFYGKAFGWQMINAGPNYTLVQPVDGGLAGGIMQAPAGAPPYVTVYVRTDDLDAKLTEIGQLSGKTVVVPTQIDGAGSFALFADPEGTVIGLLRQTEPIGVAGETEA